MQLQVVNGFPYQIVLRVPSCPFIRLRTHRDISEQQHFQPQHCILCVKRRNAEGPITQKYIRQVLVCCTNLINGRLLANGSVTPCSVNILILRLTKRNIFKVQPELDYLNERLTSHDLRAIVRRKVETNIQLMQSIKVL